MNKNRVLLIDDEPDIRELFVMTLRRMDLECDTAATFQEGLKRVQTGVYDLVITDMRLPDGLGIDIVKYIQQHKPKLPVAVITAYGNVEAAVSTLKAGAFDYVSKPIDLKMLKDLVSTALSIDSIPKSADVDSLIGDSELIRQLRSNILRLARNQAPVFIHGASGVGKELVARLIHSNGPRRDKPFIPVNCGAIPSELMESEFFGHKKGSFTGATTDKQGLFVAAQGGTLFLDEVAELPLTMQVKLLRAIQEKAIKPIGEVHEIPVDVRILSASHKNLQEEIEAKRFRQDLYYRINVIELILPSLAERMSDVPLLAEHILKKLSLNHQVARLHLAPGCIEKLQQYDYPGNVRELENILERALAMSDGNEIQAQDIHIPKKSGHIVTDTKVMPVLDDYLLLQEKERILHALDQTKWNRTAAAKLLGISFRTLRYRLKKLGLD